MKNINFACRLILHIYSLLLMIIITGSSALAMDFYVSKNGNDNNPGTASLPWQTIQFSISQLFPGDILNIDDGNYTENLVPNISGTEQNPIIIRAINPFAVTIDGGGNAPALKIGGATNGVVRRVSYLTFEGLKLQNSGPRTYVLLISSRDGQPATGNTDTHHISLRKIAVQGSCTLKNCTAITIARANDVLLEDAWVYGAGRYTLLTYGSRNITVRRVVVRWDFWDGIEDKPNDPRIAVGIYNTNDSLFENVIVLDAGKRPIINGVQRLGDKKSFSLNGGNNGNTAPFISSNNNQFYGLVIFNNIGLALALESRAAPHDGNLFENSVIYGNSSRAITLNKKVTNNTFNKMTMVNHPNEGYTANGQDTSGNAVINSIIMNNNNRTFRGEVTESYNIVFNNNPNYVNGSTPGNSSLIIDPEQLYLFKNDTTPLLNSSNLGSDNQPRGAHLILRYKDGVETTQSIWPWPFEDEIRLDFCNQSTLATWGRVGDNSSQWCDSGLSLTQYLWESSSTLACPNEICDGNTADLIFSNNFE